MGRKVATHNSTSDLPLYVHTKAQSSILFLFFLSKKNFFCRFYRKTLRPFVRCHWMLVVLSAFLPHSILWHSNLLVLNCNKCSKTFVPSAFCFYSLWWCFSAYCTLIGLAYCTLIMDYKKQNYVMMFCPLNGHRSAAKVA